MRGRDQEMQELRVSGGQRSGSDVREAEELDERQLGRSTVDKAV